MKSRSVIQTVTVEWDKSARGGEGAELRANVPAVLALPNGVFSTPDNSIAVHRVTFSSENRFCVPVRDSLEMPLGNESFIEGCVELKPGIDEIEVWYRWSFWQGGAPKRVYYDVAGNERPLRKKAFSLGINQWGWLEYNGRFSSPSTGNWSYRYTRANIGFFGELSPRVFVDSNPTFTYSEMGELW